MVRVSFLSRKRVIGFLESVCQMKQKSKIKIVFIRQKNVQAKEINKTKSRINDCRYCDSFDRYSNCIWCKIPYTYD